MLYGFCHPFKLIAAKAGALKNFTTVLIVVNFVLSKNPKGKIFQKSIQKFATLAQKSGD
jgi:hypothetical protein